MAQAYLNNRLLGELPLPPGHSLLLVCPQCGEGWARLVRGGLDTPTPWSVNLRGCPKHLEAYPGFHPGSLVYSHTWPGMPHELILAHASPAVLKHEFEMALRRAELPSCP